MFKTDDKRKHGNFLRFYLESGQ